MTDLRKAANMALRALEFNYPLIEDYGNKEQLDIHHEAIMALCQALAQPDETETLKRCLFQMQEAAKALAQPEQEPVAWMVRDQVDGCRYPSALKNPAGSINGESQPLYTAPPNLAQPEQEPVNTMPTKIVAPNLEQILNAAGFYRREWVGLTDDDCIEAQKNSWNEYKNGKELKFDGFKLCKNIEQILKEKNNAV